MKYYITYKTWNKKTDTIETVKHDFEKSFNSLLDFFNFLLKVLKVPIAYIMTKSKK
jgi:hypothetical protein